MGCSSIKQRQMRTYDMSCDICSLLDFSDEGDGVSVRRRPVQTFFFPSSQLVQERAPRNPRLARSPWQVQPVQRQARKPRHAGVQNSRFARRRTLVPGPRQEIDRYLQQCSSTCSLSTRQSVSMCVCASAEVENCPSGKLPSQQLGRFMFAVQYLAYCFLLASMRLTY